MIFYIQARLRGKNSYYSIALLTTLAAMLTKPMAMTLPFALFLCEMIFFGLNKEELLKRGLALFPFFLTIAIVPSLVALYGTSEFGGVKDITRQTLAISRSDYLLTQLNVMRTYIRLLFFPIHQNLDYDYPLSHRLLEPKTFLSFFFLLGIFLFAVRAIRWQRLLAFGILFFFLGLSAESSFYPLIDVLFEHRLYLPMVGFSVFASTSLYLLLRDLKRFAIVSSCIILIFSVATYRRNHVWRDEISLWEDTVQKSPRKSRPHNNLGFAYGKKGPYEKAIRHCQKAIELDPGDPSAYTNLAFIYTKKGDDEKAIAYYRKAIQVDLSFIKAYINLASSYGKRGDYDKALEYSQKAVQVDPLSADAYANLAAAYGGKGDLDKEIEYCRKAIQLDPTHAYAHLNLGIAYGRKGNDIRVLKQIEKLRTLKREDLVIQLEETLF